MKKFWDSLLSYIDVLVLFACLSLVFGTWYWGVKHDSTSEHKLAENTQKVSEKFDEYVEHMFDYTGAIKGFYEGSDEVTQEELSIFVKAMMDEDIGKYSPLLRFVVFKSVKNEEIDDFVKSFAKEHGRKDYTVEVDKNFDHQFISINIVDGSGGIVAPSGQNLRLFDDRRTFLEKMDRREKSFVGLVPTIRNVPEYSGRAIIMGLPINSKDGDLWGFVTAVLSVDSLIKEVDSWQDSDISWGWMWNDQVIATEGGKLSSARKAGDSFVMEPDNGQNLKFEFVTDHKVADYWNWVLGLGILMSFVVYGMVYALSLSGAKTKEMAAEMTKDLTKFKLALDSNNSHVIITDPDGVIIYANEAVTRLTGYSQDEILGKTPRLWGKQMPAEFYEKFWDTIKNKLQVFRGEITNMKKSGELYVADAIVSPIISQEGELLGFVGVEQDVTDRKRDEESMQKHTEEVEKLNDLMVDRELKMIEMKKEIDNMRSKSDKTK